MTEGCFPSTWKELANSRSESSSDESRPSSISPEAREKVRAHLAEVAREWMASDEKREDSAEEKVSIFTRTEGEEHPAAWVGGIAHGSSFEGVILCDSYFRLREPLYVGNRCEEPWKQALVGLGDGDLVIHVEGPLPVEEGNESLEVTARRVEDREKVCSSDPGGTDEVDWPRSYFFKLLRKYPQLRKALSSQDRNGRFFVANRREEPVTETRGGVVKKFFEDEGYGFLEAEGLSEEVYFHKRDTNGTTPRVGDEVRFDLVESVGGLKALNLKVSGKAMEEGVIDWFSAQKGYGFITGRKGAFDDVFVHETDVEGGVDSLTEEDPVKFRTEMGKEGPRAVEVERMPD